MVNGCRESDSLIVSGKPSNKIRDNKRMAEEVEKRRLAEGNLVGQNKGRTQGRVTLPRALNRVRQDTARYYLRQEPSALVAHAGICTGGAG
jgi:hypothetical protein